MESLKDRLESHFNLFHADLIEEAINNDNISKADLVNAILKIQNAEKEDDDEYVPGEFCRTIRIKFTGDVVLSGVDLTSVREKWEDLPLFSKEARECYADFCEIVLVEDTDTHEDLSDEWNNC